MLTKNSYLGEVNDLKKKKKVYKERFFTQYALGENSKRKSWVYFHPQRALLKFHYVKIMDAFSVNVYAL